MSILNDLFPDLFPPHKPQSFKPPFERPKERDKRISDIDVNLFQREQRERLLAVMRTRPPSEDEIISSLGGESAAFPEGFVCPNCGSVKTGGGFMGSDGPWTPSHNVPLGTIRCAGCGRFWTADALSRVK